jgi:heat shock protein HslJ
MRLARLSPLLLVVALADGSCAWAQTRPVTPPPRIGDKLIGTKWQAQAIDGRAVATPADMTIDFLQGDHVRGQAGCNRFVGPFASRGDRITLGILRQSRQKCDATQQAEQQQLIDLLHGATLAKVANDTLILTGRHGEEITFVPRDQ